VSVEELDVVLAFLDVGHGDSAVIRFREGHQVRTVVVDGGGPERSRDLLSYLLRNTIKTIDLLIASHIDRNHIAGLLPVVDSDRITIHSFWGPGCESTQPSVPGLRTADERTYQRLYSRVAQRVRPERIVCPTRGMPLPALFSNATITVLNPSAPNVLKPAPRNAPKRNPSELALEQNERALALHLECQGLRALLPSDIEGAFWAAVPNDAGLQEYLGVDIVKVPNFGRPSGFPSRIVRYFNERRAGVFSIGADVDKQPSSEVLAVMGELRAQVFCTEHAQENTFCNNPRCPAARGGQNVVFFYRRGARSFPPGGEACTLHGSPKPPVA